MQQRRWVRRKDTEAVSVLCITGKVLPKPTDGHDSFFLVLLDALKTFT